MKTSNKVFCIGETLIFGSIPFILIFPTPVTAIVVVAMVVTGIILALPIYHLQKKKEEGRKG